MHNPAWKAERHTPFGHSADACHMCLHKSLMLTNAGCTKNWSVDFCQQCCLPNTCALLQCSVISCSNPKHTAVIVGWFEICTSTSTKASTVHPDCVVVAVYLGSCCQALVLSLPAAALPINASCQSLSPSCLLLTQVPLLMQLRLQQDEVGLGAGQLHSYCLCLLQLLLQLLILVMGCCETGLSCS